MPSARAVRTYVGAVALLAGICLVVAAFNGRHHLVEDIPFFIAFTAALVISWSFPLVIFQHDREGEVLDLTEAFFVAMAMILAPFQVLLALGLGVAIGYSSRRRVPIRAIFNTSQCVIAGAVGLLVVRFVAGDPATLGPKAVAGVIAGAAVFLLVQSGLVAGVISIVEKKKFRSAFVAGLQIRMLIWAGNVSAGLLAGIAGVNQPWALVLAVVPVAVLQLAFNSHLRARKDRERMNGLFETAVKSHASMGIADVERALAESARSLLRCNEARFDGNGPMEGELGARIGNSRWLILSDRLGVEPFDDADRSMLEAIVAIGAAALDNASLYKQTRDEKKKLADVVDSSSDGIFSLDNDERITLWSPAMEEISGLRAEEMVGTGHLAALRPRDADGKDVMSHGWTRARAFPEPSLQITTRTGEIRWLGCTFSSLSDGGCVVVARDVTSQKEADDLKSDFLGTVSHELRTPLTPIQGFLQTLLRSERTFSEEERTQFYEIMLTQSERLGRLVEQILDAVSIQERRRSFVPEPMDLESAAKSMIDLARRQDPDRSFIFEAGNDLPRALADEERIEQVLSNLINNSIKYSFPEHPIRISIKAEQNQILTTVSDRGPGISAADRERIFERFTRLGDHLTRAVGGVGLGLYISRQILEGMGGHIWVEDAPGGGASFTFSIPSYREPSREPPGEPKLRIVGSDTA